MSSSFPRGDKATWQAQADSIRNGDVTLLESDIPMLLEWLQDMNWPGAQTVAEYLVGFGDSLIAPIQHVLRSRDSVWAYWVLQTFKDKFDAGFWTHLSNDVAAIAREPDRDGAHVVAMEILAQHRLLPTTELRQLRENLRSSTDIDEKEFNVLDRLLSIQ